MSHPAPRRRVRPVLSLLGALILTAAFLLLASTPRALAQEPNPAQESAPELGAAEPLTPTLDALPAPAGPLLPFFSDQHEYRVNATTAPCGPDGTVRLKLTPQSNRTSSANMLVTVTKCAGGAFVKSGTIKVYALAENGQAEVLLATKSYAAGATKVELTIQPYRQVRRERGYQVRLFSSDGSAAKLTNVVRAAAWGRCWCTDYVFHHYSFLRDTSYPDGGAWGGYLLNNGWRKLDTKNELPRVGDVVVMTNINHVGILSAFSYDANYWKVTLNQGGSAETGWTDDSFCYNRRTQPFAPIARSSTSIAFYRR